MWSMIRRSQQPQTVSNSPPLPAAATPVLGASASDFGPWDRLEADIKVLQQQALATQKAIQQVNSRSAGGPMDGAHNLPSGGDLALLGAAAALALTALLLGWVGWIRPKRRQHTAVAVPQHTFSDSAPASLVAVPVVPPSAPTVAVPSAPPITVPPVDDRLFTRVDPNMGFDPEVAATEVVRVRKSLAEKREARALQLESEDAGSTSNTHIWLDPQPAHIAPAPAGVDLKAPTIAMTPTDPAIETDIALDIDLEQEPPLPEAQGLDGSDFGITLALAQESEALDLWPEARELANEVLESHDARLRAQAQDLLERLDQRERRLNQEPKAAPPASP